MRILVTGATGLIGSAVVAALAGEGHEVVAVVRREGAAARRLPVRRIVLDIEKALRPEDWRAALAGVDAVVNCAGLLQDGPFESVARTQRDAPTALFAACAAAGVRRVVHVSAVGIDHATPTLFSQSKRSAELALAAHDLDWVVLRPSVVVGRAAYGGSALFRGLAALPLLPVLPDTGLLQVVQLDDLARTVVVFVQGDAPAEVTLELVGPERLAFADVIAAYRAWLGWRPAVRIPVPRVAGALLFGLGDLLGRLGWRVPVRSTAGAEIRVGSTGSAEAWTAMTGIVPTSLRAALAANPASVQERWFAGLYLAKPLVFGVLSLFWIATGLISLGPAWSSGVALLQAAGAGALSAPLAAAGAAADIAVGVAIAVRRTARRGLWAAMVLAAGYLAAGTVLMPGLWADPLGPLLKILPVLALAMVALAILDDR